MANFLFTLGQDDNEKATRCFQLAKIAHGKGHTVNVFFIDAGVTWADSTRDFSKKQLPVIVPMIICNTLSKMKYQ